MSGLFSPSFWYIDIKNSFEIKGSTDSKVGTEKSEVDQMKAQSLGNHQTLSASITHPNTLLPQHTTSYGQPKSTSICNKIFYY